MKPDLARIFSVLATATVVAVAPKANSAGTMPRYSDLPVARMLVPPSGAERPSSIPGSETVPSWSAAYPMPFADGRVVAGSVLGAQPAPMPRQLHAAKGARPPMAKPRPSPPPAIAPALNTEEPRGCFGQIAQTGALPTNSEWMGLGPRALVGANVAAAHGERVVEDGGAVRLEMTDVWVDGATRGMRLIGSATIPLRRVQTLPGGFEVYVGRDERPDGRRFVQFVLRRQKDAPVLPSFGGRGVMASQLDGTSTPSTFSCSHFRVSLPSTESGAETSTLQLATVLPPLAPGEKSSALSLPDFTPPASPLGSGDSTLK
jgi:hypothetical protein